MQQQSSLQPPIWLQTGRNGLCNDTFGYQLSCNATRKYFEFTLQFHQPWQDGKSTRFMGVSMGKSARNRVCSSAMFDCRRVAMFDVCVLPHDGCIHMQCSSLYLGTLGYLHVLIGCHFYRAYVNLTCQQMLVVYPHYPPQLSYELDSHGWFCPHDMPIHKCVHDISWL